MNSLFWQVRSRTEIIFDQPSAWTLVCAIALVVASAFAMANGAVDLALQELPASIVDVDHPFHAVIWDVRLPRIVCGAIVGMDLALAGALLQTTVRNPLADPGILGVTAGAGVGALFVILFAPGHSEWIPWAGFAGGMLAVGTLLSFAAAKRGQAGTLRVVLSGVALQSVLFAVIALMTFIFADRAPAFAAYIVGSLNGLGWSDAGRMLLPSLLGLAAIVGIVRTLNLLLLDDSAAGGLGVHVVRSRMVAASAAALLTAAAVSAAGLIGFVGLVVPNAIRLLVGPQHGDLLPATALGGAALVVVADLVARTVLAPLELPVGALLSLVGGPYFLYLLWRKLA
ncbi:MAG: iron ABC transporter permease [Myxococcota bacterium]